MSKLQNRLTSLQPYLIQLRFPEGVPVVDMVFKNGWVVPKSEIIKSNKGDDNEVNYHMFYSTEEDVELDDILDYIEKVIGLNIEREEKHKLLKIKAKELAELFKKTPLSELKNMGFILNKDKLVKDLEPDTLDVIDFDIETPIVKKKAVKPQPSAVKPQPSAVKPQPIVETEIVDDPNVRRAPNGEIIPPLTPIDNGDIDGDDYKKFDLTEKALEITKNVGGKNIGLPPKNKPTVELIEFNEPTNIVCKCKVDDICPACEEEKIGQTN